MSTRVGGAPLVKVLDFGISKVLGEANSGLTQTQTTIGSPLYMAPEQMKSARNVDGRADIWALGVVLYKLVSGEVPFEADTLPSLCYKVVNDPPRPLAEVRPDVPPGFAEVVTRCLEKDPERRFANIGELASSLEPFAPAASYAVAERARSVSAGARGSFAALPQLFGPVKASSSPSIHPTAHSTESQPRQPSGHPATQPSQPAIPPSPPVNASQTPHDSVGKSGPRGTLPIPTLSSWGDTKGGAKSIGRAGILVGLGVLVGVGALGAIALMAVTRIAPHGFGGDKDAAAGYGLVQGTPSIPSSESRPLDPIAQPETPQAAQAPQVPETAAPQPSGSASSAPSAKPASTVSTSDGSAAKPFRGWSTGNTGIPGNVSNTGTGSKPPPATKPSSSGSPDDEIPQMR